MWKYLSSIGSITALFVGGVMACINEHPVWSYILWGLAGILLIISLLSFTAGRRNTPQKKRNWIIAYQKRNRQLPVIPDYLLPVVIKYTKGKPISKEIELINMSGQFWNNLLPSQKEELRQMVEWLGMNWDDYLEQMRRMLPRDLKLGRKNNPFQ